MIFAKILGGFWLGLARKAYCFGLTLFDGFRIEKKRYLACCGSLGFVNKDSLICDAVAIIAWYGLGQETIWFNFSFLFFCIYAFPSFSCVQSFFFSSS
jgi:hypothetical protein